MVELATLPTQEVVLAAIIESCVLTLPGPTVDVAQVVASLGRRRKLLVLDNAEHVIAAVARIVDALVTCNDMLRVLVTSREPLRIMPETVFKVDPLAVPPAGSTDAENPAISAHTENDQFAFNLTTFDQFVQILKPLRHAASPTPEQVL